jgi:16S rRNA (cytidine1402-2'-O)-methyltransferase
VTVSGLAVCATPIGNLDDVTLRVLSELRTADLILCEDTRHTRILLDRHGIEARSVLSLHQHNEAARIATVLPRLAAGERVALVSDAGLPGVSDPGARVIAAALEAGAVVTVLPGASAVQTALVASGFPGDRYRFVGFIPRKSAEREALWAELSGWRETTVAFESPRRLPATLASLSAADPLWPIAVCRELTKRFEEIVRGAAEDVARQFATAPKGEITLVLGARHVPPADDAALVASVEELVSAGASRRVAVDVVARLSGGSRRALYEGSLSQR